jgi:uncharacterized protein (DUF697 family)/tellurite resistance protein
MTPSEQEAVLTLAVLAAFADGANSEREREAVKRVAASLGPDARLEPVLQRVLLGRATIADAAAKLGTPELRRLAFELAVGVCDADGARGADETRFIDDLGRTLGLAAPEQAEPLAVADALASVSLADADTRRAPAPAASDAELDAMVLNYAILNGALELLPQSIASMAIVPLQVKMVYRIGRSHGFELDRGHVKDFIAAAGVGLTGQYLEGVARKVVGGLLGALGGRVVGGLGRGATGMAFSFATTYALGQVAKRYYATGRTMSAATLREAFEAMLAQAKGLQERYAPRIEEQARSLDVAKVVELVRSR